MTTTTNGQREQVTKYYVSGLGTIVRVPAPKYITRVGAVRLHLTREAAEAELADKLAKESA